MGNFPPKQPSRKVPGAGEFNALSLGKVYLFICISEHVAKTQRTFATMMQGFRMQTSPGAGGVPLGRGAALHGLRGPGTPLSTPGLSVVVSVPHSSRSEDSAGLKAAQGVTPARDAVTVGPLSHQGGVSTEPVRLCPGLFSTPARNTGCAAPGDSADPAATDAASCPRVATLPGNKCGNLLRKLRQYTASALLQLITEGVLKHHVLFTLGLRV